MLPSGRFRAFARVKAMKEAQVFDRQTAAMTWAEKTEERMRAGKWRAEAITTEVQREMTVARAFGLYRESEAWLEKGDITRRVELGKQKPVIEALGSKALRTLTRDDVIAYVAARRKSRPLRNPDPEALLSPDQIRLEVASLSAMCNWALDGKHIDANPTRDVKRPTSNRRTVRLHDEQIGAILEHNAVMKNETAYVFFRILFATVCRPGELATARREWLRESPPQISIPRGKNDDERTIIIPVSLYQLLRAHLERQPSDCPFIFGTKKLQGKGWSPYNYAAVWKIVARDLGLRGTGIVPHVARHEGVSRLFERTELSDGQIAAISGHRSSQALWRYKHLRAEHSRGIVNALDDQIANAIDRAISPLHPSKGWAPGEMLKPREDAPEDWARPSPEYMTEEEWKRRQG